MIRYYLEMSKGGIEKKVFQFRTPMTIGRDPDNDIQLLDSTVSRRHAEVYWKQGQVIVEDLDSQNGTLVNGERIDRAVLSIGDILRIGKVDFQLVQSEDPVDGYDLSETMELMPSSAPGRAGVVERRRHTRYPLEFPMSFSLSATSPLAEKFGGKTFQATSIDVSISGVRFKIKDPSLHELPLGSQLRLEMSLPRSTGLIRCLATARNIFKEKKEHDVWYVGVEFSQMSSDHRNNLYKAIIRNAENSPPSPRSTA